MSTKHKLRATIPYGDPDIGAEIEVEIAFNFTPGRPAVMYLRNGDPGYPADPAEIEFVSAAMVVNGKLHPYDGPFPVAHQQTLDAISEDWFYSDEGQSEAYAAVADDDEYARDQAAEQRRDLALDRWNPKAGA